MKRVMQNVPKIRQPRTTKRMGRVSYAAAAWLLGLPLPVILIALLWGGCTKW